MRKDFLFATWSGGGAVPPVSVARALRERGHGVRVLADRSLHEEVAVSGVEPIAWTAAPQGDAADPAKDIIKDSEARTPVGALTRLRETGCWSCPRVHSTTPAGASRRSCGTTACGSTTRSGPGNWSCRRVTHRWRWSA